MAHLPLLAINRNHLMTSNPFDFALKLFITGLRTNYPKIILPEDLISIDTPGANPIYMAYELSVPNDGLWTLIHPEENRFWTALIGRCHPNLLEQDIWIPDIRVYRETSFQQETNEALRLIADIQMEQGTIPVWNGVF